MRGCAYRRTHPPLPNLRHYGGGTILIDFDWSGQLRESLAADRRPPDGLLHCSSDLIGSLRHAMLTAAGAPTLERTVVDSMPLILGTLIHRWLETSFRAAPVMNEVDLTKHLPMGWTGTADAFMWNAERRGFVLVDYKTCAPDGIPYILRDGIKQEHQWQASAYFWAAVRMGIPIVNGYGVLYLPKGRPRRGTVEPLFVEGTPLPQELVEDVMASRWAATAEYISSLEGRTFHEDSAPETWLSDALAPVQPRVQKLEKDGTVKLIPHWSAAYCQFPDALCDCRTQGETKIGHVEDGVFVPRKGYEEITPTI